MPGDFVVGVGSLHRVIDGFQQIISGQPLRDRDRLLQLAAAVHAAAGQGDAHTLAELEIA